MAWPCSTTASRTPFWPPCFSACRRRHTVDLRGRLGFDRSQGAALGAMSATQAFGFLVGPLLASYLYSIQHSLPLMVDAGILLLCAAMAMRLPRRLQAG